MRARRVIKSIAVILFLMLWAFMPGGGVEAQSATGSLPGKHGEPSIQVPLDDWSYAVISEFARKGFEDECPEVRAIKGGIVTRYEMAWIVSRLLDWGKRNGMDPDQLRGKASGPLALQVEKLKRLKEEFSEELKLVALNKPLGLGTPPVLEAPPAPPKGLPTSIPMLTLSDLLSEASRPPLQQEAGPKEKNVPAPGQRTGETGKSLELTLGKDARAQLAIGSVSRKVELPPGKDDEEPLASLGVEYSLPDLMVRAAYSLSNLSGDEAQTGLATRGMTSIALDYRVPLAQGAILKAGYTYSRIMDRFAAGASLGKLSDIRLDLSNPLGKSAAFSPDSFGLIALGDGRKTTASLGLGYTIDSNLSLALGYKLIDFSEPRGSSADSKRTNVASAEIEVKF